MGKGALVTYESGDFFRLLLQIRGSIFDNVLSKVRPGCPAAMPRRAREPDFFSREQKSAPPGLVQLLYSSRALTGLMC